MSRPKIETLTTPELLPGHSKKELDVNQQFVAAKKYADLIPKMKPASRREGVRRLLMKIKAAIGGNHA